MLKLYTAFILMYILMCICMLEVILDIVRMKIILLHEKQTLMMYFHLATHHLLSGVFHLTGHLLFGAYCRPILSNMFYFHVNQHDLCNFLNWVGFR